MLQFVHAVVLIPAYLFVLGRTAILWNHGLVTEWTCWVDVSHNDWKVSGWKGPYHNTLLLAWVVMLVLIMIALESGGAAIRSVKC